MLRCTVTRSAASGYRNPPRRQQGDLGNGVDLVKNDAALAVAGTAE